jgi:hypothetical protein
MEKKYQPVYSVLNTPSLIYDKASVSSKIKLVLHDSIAVNESVYVTSVAIWNKGDEAIEKDYLRKDFFVYCSDSSSHILDYKKLQENEPGISNFKLTPVGDSIRIEWDRFDPGYGLKLQIIYTGVKSTKICATGSVLGAELIPVVVKPDVSTLGFMILIFAYCVLLALVLWVIVGLFTEAKKNKINLGERHSYIFAIIITAILIGVAILFFYMTVFPFLGVEVPF